MSNSETKVCQNCHNSFVIDAQDFNFYEKVNVPAPTFCHTCRFERRIAYRNEHKLFWNKHYKTGERLLSIYPLQSKFALCTEKEWWSDGWDGLQYGKDYDFKRTFFEQFIEIVRAIPHNARANAFNQNSDYVANTGRSKNCYLLFNTTNAENCVYGNAANYCKECFETSHCEKCEMSYESFWNANCFGTHFSSYCESCINVWFSRNCIGCADCFGCINLRNKKFYIFNQPYSREEYQNKFAEMNLHTWAGLISAQKQAHAFWLKNPVKFMQGIKNVNVTGEYVTHSKNVFYGYLVRGGENLRYCQYLAVPNNKDCMDITIWGDGNELCYENSICGWGLYNAKFCYECWPRIKDAEYSMFCKNISDCFGCAGLANKQYCILNQQYTKEQYHELRKKIISHMNAMPFVDKKGNIYKYGEFFPIEHSPFGVNTSIVSEYFEINKEKALEWGYPWDNSEAKEYETTIKTDELADSIKDVSDAILSEIISCKDCKKAYRIIKMELDFLRALGIPLPRYCVDCRHKNRISQRNRYRFYKRKCCCDGTISHGGSYHNVIEHFHGNNPCPNEFETSYSPDRPEIVYCEQCYQSEML